MPTAMEQVFKDALQRAHEKDLAQKAKINALQKEIANLKAELGLYRGVYKEASRFIERIETLEYQKQVY